MKIKDLDKYNSTTKYASILTYHELGEKGRLLPKLQYVIPLGIDIYGYEKVDGTNTRVSSKIDIDGYDYFIGSREDWLTAMGDRVYNNNVGIVDTMRGIDIENRVKALYTAIYDGNVELPFGIYTVHGEVYGGNINAYKQYTSTKKVGFRIFDVSYISFEEYAALEMQPRESVAHWRDNGGQHFLNAEMRSKVCAIMGFEQVPHLFTMKSDDLPVTLEEALEFLGKYKNTKAGIDANGDAEGVVIRTENRGIIAKIRDEDYMRTLTGKKK